MMESRRAANAERHYTRAVIAGQKRHCHQHWPDSQHDLLPDPVDSDIAITMVQHAAPLNAIGGKYSPISMEGDTFYLQCQQSPGDGSGHSPGGSTRRQHSPAGLLSLSEIKLEPDDDCHVVASPIRHEPTTTACTASCTTELPAAGGAVSPELRLAGGEAAAGGNRIKKKAPGIGGKSIEEELCLICGDRASGYHYNALSCEGCKGFFRRSITRGATYTCKYGGNCEMDMWMRRRCQSCRLRRCREVGMKEECLLSEDQCKARDVRRKARQRMQKVQLGSDLDAENHQSPDSNTATTTTTTGATAGAAENKNNFQPVNNPLNCVTPDNRELIECIVYYQDKYELPTDDDLHKVSTVQISDEGRPKDMTSSMYKMVAEMTILTTQLVIEFAKHLPGFNTISRDDQIILLKGSASEIMVLRTARRYDLQSESVIFGNGVPMTKDSMKLVGLDHYVDCLFVFCHKMAELGVDNAEYALITAMCLLTERPGITDQRRIDRLHDMYLHALLDYQTYRRPPSSHFLAKLLLKFTELRTISQIHSDTLYNLKLEKGSLPPLLSEYFDMDKD